MKILLINVTCNQGSTGKIVFDLYREYCKNGHEVSLCYGRGPDINEHGIFKFTSDWKVRFHALQTRLIGHVGIGNKQATRKLIRHIKDFQPDIVHLHNIHGYYVDAYMLLSYLKQSHIRTVFTLHDEWVFTGKCGHSYSCIKWNKNCGSCPQKKEYPKSLFFDRTEQELRIKRDIFNSFNNIVFVTVATWVMEKARQSPHLADKCFKLVNNGINTDVFKPIQTESLRKKLGLAESRILLHVTPNFNDPHKGGEYVLDLAQRSIEEPVKVIVVGVKEPLQNIPSNMICIPRIADQQELACYYSLADALLLTSDMECLPTVCLESLCCGTPVIGFYCDGAGDAVPNGYGEFVPYGDKDALVNLLHRFLNGEIVLRSKEECAAYGKSRYDKRLMAEKYLEIYKGFLE